MESANKKVEMLQLLIGHKWRLNAYRRSLGHVGGVASNINNRVAVDSCTEIRDGWVDQLGVIHTT